MKGWLLSSWDAWRANESPWVVGLGVGLLGLNATLAVIVLMAAIAVFAGAGT